MKNNNIIINEIDCAHINKYLLNIAGKNVMKAIDLFHEIFHPRCKQLALKRSNMYL